MFPGPQGKAMMIQQGYVPAGCKMDDAVAGLLIHSEVTAGRDPCAGCNISTREQCSATSDTQRQTSDTDLTLP